VSVATLCRGAVLLVRDEAMRLQVEVALQLDEALPEITGQKVRLGQAVLALLLNAVDASFPGGHVRLEAGPDAHGWLRVAVSDDGRGVSEEDARILFEPFRSGSGRAAGVGLGLMASRVVAQSHRGELAWESTRGRGSRFVLRLPVDGALPEGA
jgi:signal transduction histidine kinase